MSFPRAVGWSIVELLTDSVAATDEAATSTAGRVRRRLGALIPYAVAALCLALVMRKHSPQAIYDEVVRAQAWVILPMPMLMLLVTMLLMTVTDLLLLGHFLPGPRYWDILRGRVACVSLEVLNYGVGKGTYGLWLARRYKAPGWVAGGLALYVVAGELCSMCIVGSGAIWLGGAEVPEPVLWAALAIAAGLLLSIVLGPLKPLGDITLLRPWTELPRWRGLLHIALRVVQHSIAIVITAVAARAFGLDVPYWTLLAYIPVIAVLSALPLNVFGIGLAQGAWLMLEPWASGERLVAFSIIWGTTLSASVVLRGLPFVRGVYRDLGLGPRAAAHNLSGAQEGS